MKIRNQLKNQTEVSEKELVVIAALIGNLNYGNDLVDKMFHIIKNYYPGDTVVDIIDLKNVIDFINQTYED